MDWYKDFWTRALDFAGRSCRLEYWGAYLVNLGALFVIMFLEMGVLGGGSGRFPFLTFLFVLALMIPTLAVTVRRLHDTDRSGWWYFISLVPGIGPLVLFVFLVLSGTEGRNRFGMDPRGAF